MIHRAESDTRPTDRFPWIWIALGLVLAVAAILRFWEIGTNFHFMGDEGTQSLAEWNLIHGHLPLLGPSLSIGQMHPHLGPLFYYLAAGPLWLAGGSPVGPTVFVGLCGVATVLVLFLYLRVPLGDWPALGASAVMATSFLMVEYSRRPWNPTPTPLFALLFLWSLVLWKRYSTRYGILTAGTLAALLQLQPVNVFIVAILVMFLALARPARPAISSLILAVGLFLAISLPLIMYDLTHGFSNTSHWLDALLGHKHSSGTHLFSGRVLFNLFNRAFEPRVVVISILLALALCLAAVVVAFVDHDAVGANWELIMPLLLLATAAVGFEVYRGEVFEQYMVCLFPIPFIFLAALLRLLRRGAWRYAAMALVIGLFAVGIRDVRQYTFITPEVTVASAGVTSHDLQPDDTYGHVLAVNRVIERWTRYEPYRLEMASPYNAPQGYAYALARDGHPPTETGPLDLVLLVQPPSFPERLWAPDIQRPDWPRQSMVIGNTKIIFVP